MIVYLFDKVLTQEAAVDVLLPGGWALHLYQHIGYINALSYINIHMLSYQRTGVFFSFLLAWRARLLSSFLVISIYADISDISTYKCTFYNYEIKEAVVYNNTTDERLISHFLPTNIKSFSDPAFSATKTTRKLTFEHLFWFWGNLHH